MTDLVTALSQRVLICDGAMGTILHAAGNSLDRALPELNLSNPGLVSTVHESYLSAGADMILTNTFGASRLRLADQGFGELVREINLAGVRIAARARDAADRQVFIAYSVAPAVTASQRRRVAQAQRVEAIREQVEALAEGGVNALILETFGYLEELSEAIAVAVEYPMCRLSPRPRSRATAGLSAARPARGGQRAERPADPDARHQLHTRAPGRARSSRP